MVRASIVCVLVIGIIAFAAHGHGQKQGSSISPPPRPTLSKPEATFHGWRVNPLRLQSGNPIWINTWLQVASSKSTPKPPAKLLPILRQGDPSQKTIALTFDDGPHPAFTKRLLALLKKENIKASFFVVGRMVVKSPDTIREISKAGHLIGNHTFSHVTLTKLSLDEVRIEYRATDSLIERITGKKPLYCRPPGGKYNKEVLKGSAEEGLTTVLWTDDPGDYANPGDNTVLQKAFRRMSNGGIILLHDGVEETLQTLPKIIAYARSKGYKFVTVDQLKPANKAFASSTPKPSGRLRHSVQSMGKSSAY